MIDSAKIFQITYDGNRKRYLMTVPPAICGSLSLDGDVDGLLLSHTDRKELEQLKNALVSAAAAGDESRSSFSAARRRRMVMAWTGIVISGLLIVFEKVMTQGNELLGWLLRISVSLLMMYCFYAIFVTYHDLGSGIALDQLSRDLEKVRLQQEIRQRFS